MNGIENFLLHGGEKDTCEKMVASLSEKKKIKTK
jgi:hypothetical protein